MLLLLVSGSVPSKGRITLSDRRILGKSSTHFNTGWVWWYVILSRRVYKSCGEGRNRTPGKIWPVHTQVQPSNSGAAISKLVLPILGFWFIASHAKLPQLRDVQRFIVREALIARISSSTTLHLWKRKERKMESTNHTKQWPCCFPSTSFRGHWYWFTSVKLKWGKEKHFTYPQILILVLQVILQNCHLLTTNLYWHQLSERHPRCQPK